MGLGKALEKRALVRNTSGAVGLSGSGFFGDFTNDRFDSRFSETVMRVPIVWACARVRSTRLASMDVQGPDGQLPVWMSMPSVPAEKGYIGYLSYMDLLTQCAMSYDLHGNIFFGVIRNARGTVHDLMVLDPEYVNLHFDDTKGKYRIYHTYFDGEIITVPNMMLPQFPVGVSLIYYQHQQLEMSKVGQNHVTSMLKHGGTMPFVIASEGSTTSDQKREFNSMWRKLYGGAKNSNVPALLDNGARVYPIGTTPAEGQLLQSRQFTDTQICSFFGVDPSMVGINTSGSSLTYQNLQQRESAVLVEMRALIRKLEYVFTWLNQSRKVKLVAQDVVPDETKARTFESLARVGQMTGRMVMTPEEMRSELGLPPPDGDMCEPVPQSEKGTILALNGGSSDGQTVSK